MDTLVSGIDNEVLIIGIIICTFCSYLIYKLIAFFYEEVSDHSIAYQEVIGEQILNGNEYFCNSDAQFVWKSQIQELEQAAITHFVVI